MRTGLTLSLAITSVLCGGIDAHAQTHAGLKAGTVNTNLSVSGSEVFDTDGEFGFVVGGFVGIPLGPRVRLQPELLVSERKFSIAGVSPPLSVSSRAFEMPVFIQARFGESVQPFIQAGPQVTVISSVKQRFGSNETDISDEIGDVDFGMAIGAGLEVPVKRGALLFEGRAYWGFRDLNLAPETTMRLRGVTVLGGYRF